ncbi:MAG: HNH endonuclease [Candidatus Thiodiazotropha lotti]|nr:HNH endonuclease [Candidatus Thiodiazotropha lotti]MCW4221835.1 HNH endonuclease [Candidatus Thiodiazotropha lotti]
MEEFIGRAIAPNECVHHKNGNKTDNRLKNLELMKHSNHSSKHSKELTKMRNRDARGRYA